MPDASRPTLSLTRRTAHARMTIRWQALLLALGIATREEARRVLVSLGYNDEQVSDRLHIAERIAYRTLAPASWVPGYQMRLCWRGLARGREPHIR